MKAGHVERLADHLSALADIVLDGANRHIAYAVVGFGGFLGNVVMGLVFGAAYRRWGRVMPLVVAHTLLDVVAFVGYSLLRGHVGWL